MCHKTNPVSNVKNSICNFLVVYSWIWIYKIILPPAIKEAQKFHLLLKESSVCMRECMRMFLFSEVFLYTATGGPSAFQLFPHHHTPLGLLRLYRSPSALQSFSNSAPASGGSSAMATPQRNVIGSLLIARKPHSLSTMFSEKRDNISVGT